MGYFYSKYFGLLLWDTSLIYGEVGTSFVFPSLSLSGTVFVPAGIFLAYKLASVLSFWIILIFLPVEEYTDKKSLILFNKKFASLFVNS